MKRKLQVGRGDASHDPMFKPVWTSGFDTLPTVDERRRQGLPDYPKPPLREPAPQLVLPPLPPEHPQAVQWQAALDQANAVTEALKSEPDFDGMVLVEVVTDLLNASPTAETIIEAYHQRMEMRRGC
jgi:hypothetical protein